MNICSNTYVYKLRFRIDKGVPKEYIKHWKHLKKQCERGNNKQIIENIKEFCQLEQNQNLPYLLCREGGIGGDDNQVNKQIIFRQIFWMKQTIDNDIIMDEISDTEIEKWTYEELDDLILAFIKVIEFYIKWEPCTKGSIIEGCIEMTNKNN